ncbi:MAG: SDR family oxidoreductase [Candidatus Omnitrophota bacterium]|jgi:3-oxoacyl-[acyl-carrier protein] reductase
MALVVVITGGLNGLGRYLTKRFSEEGHIVNVIDIANIERNNSQGFDYYCANIADRNAIGAVFSDIYSKKRRIDVLVNNAAKRYFSFLENASPEDIVDTIEVNLTANYITTREALKYMKKTGFGRIINISSHSSFQDYPKGSLYCATKAGLNIFTRVAAKEIDKNLDITINALCPSKIYSIEAEKEQNTDKGLILPETIFKVISKLIRSNLNGAVIPIISFRIFLITFFCQIKNSLNWWKHCIWRHL